MVQSLFGFFSRPPDSCYGPRLDCGARRARPQPQEHRRRLAARPTGRADGPVGLRQVVARLRHDLRRGAAALRRVAVVLRAPIPRADGEAGCRSDRGPVAGDRDRAEDHRLQPPVDGRDRHRNLRLPPAALCQHRRPALPPVRARDRLAVARTDRRHGDAGAQRRAPQRARADRPRPEGGVQEGTRGIARPRLHEGAHRRTAAIARRGHQDRSPAQSHGGRGRGSPGAQARRRTQARRVDRDRAEPRRRRRGDQHARRRRSAVLAAARVHVVRREHAGDDAARLFVQLASRRVSRLPGARRSPRLRSRAARAGRVPGARRRRHRALGEGRPEARSGSARDAQQDLRHRPDAAVPPAAEEGARPRLLRRRQRASRRGRGRPADRGETPDGQGPLRRRLRGTDSQPAAPLRRGHLARSGESRAVPCPAPLPGLRRRASEGAEPRRPREGSHDSRSTSTCRSPKPSARSTSSS